MKIILDTEETRIVLILTPTVIFEVLEVKFNTFDCADKKADYTDKVISLISVISIKSLCNQIPPVCRADGTSRNDSEEYFDNGETEIGSLKKENLLKIKKNIFLSKHKLLL